MTPAEAGDDAGPVGATPATDIVAGVLLAILALAALFWIVPAHTETNVGDYDVSPAFFPRLGAGVVLALALTLITTGARRHLAGRGNGRPGRRVLEELLIWGAAATVTVIGLQTIGFIATSAVVVAGWTLLAGQRRWLLVGAAAVLFPLAVDTAARVFFTVDLP